jgi:protein TonB
MKHFVALDIPAPPGPYIPDCTTFRSVNAGKQSPVAVYDPQPEYTEKAREQHIEGTVVLSLKVGANGLVEDVKLQKSLSPDLDERAVATVRE